MRILFLGDVVGRDARDAIISQLPDIRKKHKLDVIIINVENAAHGFGVTAQICDDLYKAGADCLTTGNHVWDQREILPYIDKDQRLLRPANFPEGTPGRGMTTVTTPHGEKILVVNLMARLFMDPHDDPFAVADKICKTHRLGKDVQAIFLDFHGEATSEKMALAHYCDGKISCLVGTHTHIPTADTQIFSGGTGYHTDAGMCGAYDSVVGMDKNIAINRFLKRGPNERLAPAAGAITLCGTMIDVDTKTGLCTKIEPFRTGGKIPSAPGLL